MHVSCCLFFVNKEKVTSIKNKLKLKLNLTNKTNEIIYMFPTKYTPLMEVKDSWLGDYLLI